MPSVQHRRGTAANLAALASANGLLPGQIYVITDQSRIAVALTVNTYETFAKLSEVGGGGGGLSATVEINSATPYISKFFTATVTGATVGQKVHCTVSLDMPDGVAADELEDDPLTVSGRVSATDTVSLLVASVNGSRVGGKRNINMVIT